MGENALTPAQMLFILEFGCPHEFNGICWYCRKEVANYMKYLLYEPNIELEDGDAD